MSDERCARCRRSLAQSHQGYAFTVAYWVSGAWLCGHCARSLGKTPVEPLPPERMAELRRKALGKAKPLYG